MGVRQSSSSSQQVPQTSPNKLVASLYSEGKKDLVIRQTALLGNKRSVQLGFQLYVYLVDKEGLDPLAQTAPWERFDLRFELDYPSLSRMFIDITDHLWPSDTVHLYRMAVVSVINPTPIALTCLLKGLTCQEKEESIPGIVIRLPPYKHTVIDNPVYETTTETTCRFDAMDLDVMWSLSESTPQQLIQWMLEEQKMVVCFSVMLDLIYYVKHQK